PERSKQQARRLPDASMSQPDAMRFTRVSAFLPDVIHWIQSRRARGVMSSHVAFLGCAGRWRSALNRMAPSRIDDPGTLAPRHGADQVDAGAASSTTPAPAAVRRAASAPLRSL